MYFLSLDLINLQVTLNFDLENAPKLMPDNKGFVVSDDVNNIMSYIRKELKGIEALTYLIESDDTINNLENYRKILVQKLKLVDSWKLDASTIRLDIHPINKNELMDIHSGNRGMRY